MIGIIQSVLLELVEDTGGDTAVADILQRAGVSPEREFRLDRDYDDDECLRLIRATAEHFQLDDDTLYRLYAEKFVAETRTRFPMFYDMAANARQFLKRQPAIHVSLAAGLQDKAKQQAVGAKFAVEEDGDDLIVHYRSNNRLCRLYEKLAEVIYDQYGDTGTVTKLSCQLRGDESCSYRLQFD